MKNVKVGIFQLPGISFSNGEISEALNAEMKVWATEEGVGVSMTPTLWAFRKESHREWFILRWTDAIPKDSLT
jgi:hypothetical protein